MKWAEGLIMELKQMVMPFDDNSARYTEEMVPSKRLNLMDMKHRGTTDYDKDVAIREMMTPRKCPHLGDKVLTMAWQAHYNMSIDMELKNSYSPQSTPLKQYRLMKRFMRKAQQRKHEGFEWLKEYYYLLDDTVWVDSDWDTVKGVWNEDLFKYDNITHDRFEKKIKMTRTFINDKPALVFDGGPTGHERYYIEDLIDPLIMDYNREGLCICAGTVNRWPQCNVKWKHIMLFLSIYPGMA